VKAPQLIRLIFYNNPDRYPPIINKARLLARHGIEVEILCRDDGEQGNVAYPDGVTVRRIDGRGKSSGREYAGFVAQVLRHESRRVSVFIGHDMHGFLPARLLAARHRRPLVFHCHDFNDSGFPMSWGSRAVFKFQKRFARTADLVIVPDAGLGAVMMRELRLRRAPLVVTNAPLKRPAASGEALRRALASRGRCFERIVFRQGRVGVGHAIEATLRSIPHWAKRDWGFVVMGIGESSYIEKLSRQARDLGVERQFVALPPVSYDQVGHFTPGAHLGHALYEPIHINNVHIAGACKIQEYLAAGLPLLVSDRPSLRTLVEKYGCGLTADESSPASIAAAVNVLLGDPARAERMGAAGARAFERELCYERQFQPVLEALRELSSGSASRTSSEGILYADS
jgi:glycosyltransferase involved in cell wall biosynthesis